MPKSFLNTFIHFCKLQVLRYDKTIQKCWFEFTETLFMQEKKNKYVAFYINHTSHMVLQWNKGLFSTRKCKNRTRFGLGFIGNNFCLKFSVLQRGNVRLYKVIYVKVNTFLWKWQVYWYFKLPHNNCETFHIIPFSLMLKTAKSHICDKWNWSIVLVSTVLCYGNLSCESS